MYGATANKSVVFLFLAASLLALIDVIVLSLAIESSAFSALSPIRIFLPLLLAYGVSRGSTAAYFSSIVICAVVALSSFYGLIELSVRTPFGPLQYIGSVREFSSLFISSGIVFLLQFCEFDGPSV